jgi:hypothetical protein
MKRTALLTILVLSLVLGSCKKYEDGPLISLTSAQNRIVNTWVIEFAQRDGVDITTEYEDYVLALEMNQEAILQMTVEVLDSPELIETTGFWAFEDQRKNLRLDFELDDFDRYYRILRLKQEELWLREIGFNGDELRLQPQ